MGYYDFNIRPDDPAVVARKKAEDALDKQRMDALDKKCPGGIWNEAAAIECGFTVKGVRILSDGRYIGTIEPEFYYSSGKFQPALYGWYEMEGASYDN